MPDPVSRPDPASRLVELVAKIGERRAKVVVVGQGYVGLPVAMRAAEVGFPVVGYDVDPARVDALARRPLVRRGRPRRAARRPRSPRVPPDPRSRRSRATSTSRSSPCRRRCARASPTSRSSRPRRATSPRGCARARSSCSSRRRIPARPRSCCARSSRRAGCAPSTDFFLGYSPERIDPGNPEWTFVNTPKVVSGIDAASLAGRRGVLRHARRQGRAGRLHRRGRAREAAREHVPARQHRARQRARDVRPRPRRRHLVGDRRGRDEAVRLHALHARARASAGTACRSTRRTSRGASSGASASGSGSSSSPTTSTAACPTTWSRASSRC